MKFAKSFLSLRVIGDEILRTPAASVAEITDEVRNIAQRMIAVMSIFGGIGLAGPQVGISQRIITLGMHGNRDGVFSPGEILLLPQMPLALINPRILSHCDETVMRQEGCLSVPNIYGHVERPSIIVLEAQKLDGSQVVIECGGLLACCIQHEIDHLNGTLFVKKVIPNEQYEVRRKADGVKQRYSMINYVRTEP